MLFSESAHRGLHISSVKTGMRQIIVGCQRNLNILLERGKGIDFCHISRNNTYKMNKIRNSAKNEKNFCFRKKRLSETKPPEGENLRNYIRGILWHFPDPAKFFRLIGKAFFIFFRIRQNCLDYLERHFKYFSGSGKIF